MIVSVSFSEMVDNIVALAVGYPVMSLATLMPLFMIILVSVLRIPLKKELKFIYWFCVFFFISDLPLWITSGLRLNNLDYHFFREIAVQLFLISSYFFITHSSAKKRLVLISVPILLLLAIGVFLTAKYLNKPAPTQITSLYRVGVISIVFMHFYNTISERKVRNLLNYPVFWIYSGVLILASGSIFVFLFYTYTFLTDTFFKLYSQFLDVLVILMFIFIGIGFIKAKKYYLNE